jgi:hypothetical protein
LARWGIGPSSRSADHTPSGVWTPTGLPRFAHTRHDRGGRPLYPGNRGVPTAGISFPDCRVPRFNGRLLPPR